MAAATLEPEEMLARKKRGRPKGSSKCPKNPQDSEGGGEIERSPRPMATATPPAEPVKMLGKKRGRPKSSSKCPKQQPQTPEGGGEFERHFQILPSYTAATLQAEASACGRRKKMMGKRRGRPKGGSKCMKRPQTSDEEDLSSLVSSSVATAISLARSFLRNNAPFLHPYQTRALESCVSAAAISLSNLPSSPSPSPHSPPQTLTLEIPPPIPHALFPNVSASDSSSDRLFHDYFRISKFAFDSLLQILAPSLQKSSNNTVPPECKLAAALFRLAHAATFKASGRLFGLETAAACRAFYEVCKAVNDSFADQLWSIQTDQRRILDGFEKISLPNCCGVLGFGRFFVDGGTDSSDGVVIVQALVDAEGHFVDISAGWPGSVPPDEILYRTKLFSRVVESKEMLSGPHYELATGDSIRQYVLGDACCPLLPWLMTPYRDLRDDSHQIFNSVHKRGMELGKNAFRRVLARWRLLAVTWQQEFVDVFPFVIIAGFLLHNFLIKCGEPALECAGDDSKEPRFLEQGVKKSVVGDGESIRAVLASHLSLVCRRPT